MSGVSPGTPASRTFASDGRLSLCPLPAEVGCFRLRPLYRLTEIGYTRFRLGRGHIVER
jgi:hypothetical protein